MASSSNIALRIRQNYRLLTGRTREPIRFDDAFYGFAARIITGLLSIASAVVCALVWGAINGWLITNSLLVTLFSIVFLIVFLGEHIRSRSFEKTYNFDRLKLTADSRIDEQSTVGSIKFANHYNENFQKQENVRLRTNKNKLTAGIYIKRVFELTYSAFGLFLLWPLFLGVAVCIIVEDGGPVFIRRKYELLDGKLITITSFRTFRKLKSGNNEITSVGKYLRVTSIDILPRLYDVMLGRITLIGPLGIGVYNNHRDELRLAGIGLDLKPAITGYSALAMMRREAKGRNTLLSPRTTIALVRAYERNWNFRKELLCMALIVKSVIFDHKFL